MGDTLLKILLGLLPPKDSDPVKLYAWQWNSILVGVAGLLLAIYASNLLPFVSPPYALANTVTTQNQEFQGKLDSTNRKLDVVAAQLGTALQEQKNGQIRQLNSDLIDARRYQCRSINSNDKTALPFWNNRLQDLKLSYIQLSSQAWPDLPCNSF